MSHCVQVGRSARKKEAEMNLTEEDWSNICKTIATTFCLFIWTYGKSSLGKTLRYFITPKIKELQCKNAEQGKCWRKCGSTSVGHFHIFWECSKIAPYWTEVVKRIKLITGVQVVFVYLGQDWTPFTAFSCLQDFPKSCSLWWVHLFLNGSLCFDCSLLCEWFLWVICIIVWTLALFMCRHLTLASWAGRREWELVLNRLTWINKC